MIIFYIIVSLYCIQGMVLNLIVLPMKNMEIKKQNDYIMVRYAHMERMMAEADRIMKQRKYYGKL